ncbi:MAG: histidine kinase [Pseudomonadota bacterium]
MAALTAPIAEAAEAPPRKRFADDFFAVFNLRSIAAVFYFCAALVLVGWLTFLHVEPLEQWLFSVAIGVRQTLISGTAALAAIALAQAGLPRLALPRRWIEFALAVALIGGVAALAYVVRAYVFGSPIATLLERPWRTAAIVTQWTVVGGIGYALFDLGRREREARAALAAAARERDALAAQMMQARLSALQAQIEPHFLFNTLANVKRLYETSPGSGRTMLGHLIEYLRAALPSMRQSGSSVRRELDLVRSYLTILQFRMGDRLAFDVDADATALDAELPPMVLPTLVENAIKHGLSPLPEGGRIDVRARAVGGTLIVEVSDTGAGFRASSGAGVGLANTRQRLATLYGERAQLDLAANWPRGVIARLQLPLARAVGETP